MGCPGLAVPSVDAHALASSCVGGLAFQFADALTLLLDRLTLFCDERFGSVEVIHAVELPDLLVGSSLLFDPIELLI